MRINKVSNDEIIAILKYCLYSSTFLSRIEPLKSKILHSLSSNSLVKDFVKLCIEYKENYNQAPGNAITTIIKENISSDEALQGLLALADNVIYSDIETPENLDYGIDLLIKYSNREQLRRLIETIENHISNIDSVPEALEKVENFKPIRIEEPSDINLADEKLVEEYFSSNKKCLIPLSGKIGEIIRPHTYPASLIAFQGPEKSGKSWILQYLAIQAARRHRKVAIFEAGDLSAAQRVCRIYSQLVGKPWLPNRKLEVSKLPYPQDISYDEELHEMKLKIGYKLVPVLQEEDVKDFLESKRASILKNIRLSVHVSSTLTVKQIQTILEHWKKDENFIPQVIIIDYADILDTTTGKNEDKRHKINQIWLDLRRLSQEWEACVVTATQADSKSYKKGTQTLENFSEDKRKYSHVTAMFALNKSNAERRGLVTRISPLLVREGFIETSWEVACIGDPTEANPVKESKYVKGPVQIIFPEDNNDESSKKPRPRKRPTSKKKDYNVES